MPINSKAAAYFKNKGVNLRFERLAPHLKGNVEQPDLTTYKESAFSYSSSVEWLFDDVHRLSLMYSHNERLPTPMVLYYHGKHLATSSFRFGNKNLKKEQSDKFEIGITRETGKLDYKLSLYYNNFDNYIHTSYLQFVPQMGRNFVLGLNVSF